MPHYKTLALQLIRQYPEVHYPLKEQKKLLETLEKDALELEKGHQTWQEILRESAPEAAPLQIESVALELALKELENRMVGTSQQDQESILDAAIAYIRTSPPA